MMAGGAWFFVLSGYTINRTGLKWLYFWFVCILGSLALVFILGNMKGLRYPSAGDVELFSFFADSNQTTALFAWGGIGAFCYAVVGLRGLRSLHLAGFASAALCCTALVYVVLGQSYYYSRLFHSAG